MLPVERCANHHPNNAAAPLCQLLQATGSADAADKMLDPLCIRFTHSRIRPTFSGCGRTIEQTMNEIRAGAITPADLPRITVIPLEDGESYCSLNNRRLYVCVTWALGRGRHRGVHTMPPHTRRGQVRFVGWDPD